MIIAAAVERCENYTNLTFGEQEVVFEVEGALPSNSRLELPVGTHNLITEVRANGNNLAANEYDIISVGGFVTVVLNKAIGANEVLQIVCDCGYTAANLPTSAKLAILQTVTHYFENRGDIGGALTDIPAGAKTLLNPLTKNLYFV
jgi:hypothetical protein